MEDSNNKKSKNPVFYAPHEFKLNMSSDSDDEDYWLKMWPHVVGTQDIKPPGQKIQEKLDEDTKKFLQYFGHYPPKDTGGPKDPKCTIHNWQTYEGFNEDYEFCVACDLKRPTNKKEG